jgi:hypothetical protein
MFLWGHVGPLLLCGTGTRGPGRLMRSHLLGMLEPAAILQVNRHARRPPGVAPHARQTPRCALVCGWLPRHCTGSARAR